MRPNTDLKRYLKRQKGALDAIIQGYTYLDTEKRYKIPRTTLHRHINHEKKLVANVRRELSDAEEGTIVEVLKNYAHRDVSFTIEHLNEGACNGSMAPNRYVLSFQSFIKVNFYFILLDLSHLSGALQKSVIL